MTGKATSTRKVVMLASDKKLWKVRHVLTELADKAYEEDGADFGKGIAYAVDRIERVLR